MYNTKQEYYDDIIARYRDGRLPSFHHNKYGDIMCDYNANGKQCLIGMLIPNECYSRTFEEKPVTEIIGEIYRFFPNFIKDLTTEELLYIQSIHDNNIKSPHKAILELNNHAFFSDVVKQEL